ncbi:MAG: PEP-CTERM sorting domain-containing protein [Phycisphaerales bacterium]|nr:PEP-CTERM sorting domain-containing protein [Phycisphaerales bacterium]
MAVNYNGGTILGTPTLINSSLSIAPTAANPASFLIGGGNNNLIGNINGGQLVTVEGNSTGSHAKLTSANGFVNSGTLTMQSSNGGYSSTLDVTTGDLTNAATGTININVGAGGDRTVRASLTNNGTVNINTNTSFSKTSGVYTNNHLMNIAANKAVTISSFDQTFNQNGGTLDIDGALNLYYMAVNYNGGTILGTPTLINSSLSIAPSAANPASFLIGGGNNHLIGNINGGQLVTLEGNSTGSHARLTSANGFVNSGTLTMQSSNGGYSSTLDVTTGDLTNATTGTININVGAGGNRAVRANLANNGTVHWNASGTLGTTGATHVNRGDFIIANSASTTVTGTSFINAPGGTIAGSGVFNVDTVAFTNDGKVSPGLSPGILTVDGTYNQSTSGSLYIELGGLVVGADYDRLDVDGTANLGGTLDISLLGAFVPDPGDTFVILTATDVDGFFSNAETVVAFNGGTFDVQYLDTSVTLSAYQVPEPATLSLLALGGLAMLRRRK